MQKKHITFGRHILLDIWGTDSATLNNLQMIRRTMEEAALVCGATIVKTAFQEFPVQGLSGVIVLAESHISVHTHPEHNYASFDIFTCGTVIDPNDACRYIVEKLKAEHYHQREFIRGVPTGIEDAEPAGNNEANIRLVQ